MSGTPSIVAFIPARSGSKRVKDKNIRKLGGHPLLAYTIAAAKASGVFDAVILATDSERYAGIGRHYGAEVPFLRDKAISGATSPDIEWVQLFLKELAAGGRNYDCFSILRPTSPFRLPETIQRAWQQFQTVPGIDSVRAVEKVSQHPGKMWVVRGQYMTPLMPLTPPDQPWHSTQMAALPEVYVQNASLEIAWSRVPLNGGNIAGVSIAPFLTEGQEGMDINTEEDWFYCEHLLARGDIRLPVVDSEPWNG